jgi:hypothetical protein
MPLLDIPMIPWFLMCHHVSSNNIMIIVVKLYILVTYHNIGPFTDCKDDRRLQEIQENIRSL